MDAKEGKFIRYDGNQPQIVGAPHNLSVNFAG
jgi:hypothetical protein